MPLVVAQAAEYPLRNVWWLETVLARAQSCPASLDDARTLKSDYESITLDEVNRAAAEHFRASSAYVCGIIPEAPPPQAPPPAQ